jgi:hypothetical protein
VAALVEQTMLVVLLVVLLLVQQCWGKAGA